MCVRACVLCAASRTTPFPRGLGSRGFTRTHKHTEKFVFEIKFDSFKRLSRVGSNETQRYPYTRRVTFRWLTDGLLIYFLYPCHIVLCHNIFCSKKISLYDVMSLLRRIWVGLWIYKRFLSKRKKTFGFFSVKVTQRDNRTCHDHYGLDDRPHRYFIQNRIPNSQFPKNQF